jgi:serine protease Do
VSRLPRWVLALLLVALASVPGVIVALVMTAGGAPAPMQRLAPPPPPQEPLPEATFLQDGASRLADVAARAAPGVVSILTQVAGPRAHGQGAGVLLQDDGLVLTSSHVVSGASAIRVTLDDGRELRARLLAADPPTDLALVRIDDPPGDLVPLTFGDSDRVRRADVVLAIGNPFGIGQAVTMGVVSALGRADLGIIDYEDFIQTDAAVNPGSSGGPLLDMEGRVIGINTAILSRSGGYQGIAFAVPSNMARAVADSLLEHGRVIRGWLGVAIRDAPTGALVMDVVRGSPASRAGFARGDVILTMDGRRVESAGQLRNTIAMRGPEATITLDVAREGGHHTKQVVLEELPRELARPPDVDREPAPGNAFPPFRALPPFHPPLP